MPEANSAIDFHIVRSFRKLASSGMVSPGSRPGHADGWGIVGWKNGLPTYLGREPTNAFEDPKFEEACITGFSSELNSPLIAHLRKASVGLKVKENTHPFVNGEWAFAHNGTIRKLNLRYTTDSLWFFQGLLNEYEHHGGDFTSSIQRSAESVHQIFPYTSLTFLISNGRTLYAYRDSSRNAEYYAIYYTRMTHSMVVAQEKFFDADWRELPNHSLLSIDSDLHSEVLEVPARKSVNVIVNDSFLG
jgi:predicted glutamine amidotransferase